MDPAEGQFTASHNPRRGDPISDYYTVSRTAACGPATCHKRITVRRHRVRGTRLPAAVDRKESPSADGDDSDGGTIAARSDGAKRGAYGMARAFGARSPQAPAYNKATSIQVPRA